MKRMMIGLLFATLASNALAYLRLRQCVLHPAAWNGACSRSPLAHRPGERQPARLLGELLLPAYPMRQNLW
jgi:hypothetical protein